jgi:hypothetical protein
MPQVSELQIKLVREEGFDMAFNEGLADGLSQREAFWLLNTLYRITYGEKRYKNYESYRVARSKRFKNKT